MSEGTLECLKKCDVLGDIIVLVADPLLDFDRPTCRTVDHDSNAGLDAIYLELTAKPKVAASS